MSQHHKVFGQVCCLLHDTIQHQVWVQAGSPSAFWYKTSTEYESITIPMSMLRKDAVIIHRLRLGYHCSWEIDEHNPKQCNHCQSITDKPLIYYLLECDALTAIRPPDFANIQNITPDLLETAAANCARLILENEVNLQVLSTTPPPRKSHIYQNYLILLCRATTTNTTHNDTLIKSS